MSGEQEQERQFTPNAVHLVRTSMQNMMTLSQMADQKASMLMGASFVVFTLAVGQARAGTMLVPIAILAAGAFAAALCAILCVLPKVTGAGGDIGERANLLFFGNFSHLEEADFIERMLPLLESDEAAYRTMLRDIHQNGMVLARKKYRLLGYAYRAFLVGLVLSFTAFLIELATGSLS